MKSLAPPSIMILLDFINLQFQLKCEANGEIPNTNKTKNKKKKKLIFCAGNMVSEFPAKVSDWVLSQLSVFIYRGIENILCGLAVKSWFST